jgi:hypothetical protein
MVLQTLLVRGMAPWLPLRESRSGDFPIASSHPAAALQVLHRCLIMPGASGLYTPEGQPILESFLKRGPQQAPEFSGGQHPASLSMQPDWPHERWHASIFIPYAVIDHFGHRLTETTAWLWPLLHSDSNPLRWVDPSMMVVLASHPDGVAKAEAIAPILGVPSQQVRPTDSLSKPILCHRVFLPVPSMVNRGWVAPHHFAASRELVMRLHHLSAGDRAALLKAAQNPSSTDRIYLSRSRLPSSYRHLDGEMMLERRLAQDGWQIVHPQERSIRDQLHVLAQASTVAGEASSAFHLLMFFGQEMAHKKIILLGVRNFSKDPRIHNFAAQFHHQPIDFHYLGCLGFKHRRHRHFLVSQQRVVRRMNAIAGPSTDSGMNTKRASKTPRQALIHQPAIMIADL